MYMSIRMLSLQLVNMGGGNLYRLITSFLSCINNRIGLSYLVF